MSEHVISVMLRLPLVLILLAGVISFGIGYQFGEARVVYRVLEICTYDAALEHKCPSKTKYDKCINICDG